MISIEKFANILQADLKFKIGTLEDEQKVYIDSEYIKTAIKEYLKEKKEDNVNIDFSNRQSMIAFINIEIMKYMKNKG